MRGHMLLSAAEQRTALVVAAVFFAALCYSVLFLRFCSPRSLAVLVLVLRLFRRGPARGASQRPHAQQRARVHPNRPIMLLRALGMFAFVLARDSAGRSSNRVAPAGL